VGDEDAREELLSLKFVGPATAGVLADAGVDAGDLDAKSVSHAELVDVGVNPGVAARIRREHSLQWSFSGGEDLDQRAEQVRGLHDDEREWVAASYGDDETSADGSGDPAAEESAWRTQSSPTTGVDEGDGTEEAAWREQSWPNGDEESTPEHEERAWRERSTPTSVTEIEGVDADDERLLARAGVTSVRSLAAAHVEEVADSLGVDEARVAAWKRAAADYEQ